MMSHGLAPQGVSGLRASMAPIEARTRGEEATDEGRRAAGGPRAHGVARGGSWCAEAVWLVRGARVRPVDRSHRVEDGLAAWTILGLDADRGGGWWGDAHGS